MRTIALVAVLFAIACSRVPEDPSARAAGPSATAAPTTAAPTIAPPTARPTPTPEPTIRKKVGTPATYTDGWKITVLKAEEQPGTRFSTPQPGLRFIAITILFENGSTKALRASTFDFKLQDSQGVRRDQTFCFQCRTDELQSAEIAPGGKLQGSVIFPAPVGDAKLELVYTSFGYLQATWELY